MTVDLHAVRIAAASLLAVAVAAPASAVTLFRATLDQGQETTPTGSPATGNGLVRLSDDLNFIDVSLSWAGLTLPAAAGHIHCCAPLGANGPVAIDLDPVPFTTGSVFDSFDLTDIASYSGGFLAANGGTADSARAALLAGLFAGTTYFNIHTANFPAGEIRGQIGEAVPEPAVWGLMIAGFGMVGAAMRRRTALVA